MRFQLLTAGGMSSGMSYRVVLQKLMDVSEVITVFIIRAMSNDLGSKYVYNVDQFRRDYTE
jgi:hypothetical protein